LCFYLLFLTALFPHLSLPVVVMLAKTEERAPVDRYPASSAQGVAGNGSGGKQSVNRADPRASARPRRVRNLRRTCSRCEHVARTGGAYRACRRVSAQ
jgi:hypothetical protein